MKVLLKFRQFLTLTVPETPDEFYFYYFSIRYVAKTFGITALGIMTFGITTMLSIKMR